MTILAKLNRGQKGTRNPSSSHCEYQTPCRSCTMYARSFILISFQGNNQPKVDFLFISFVFTTATHTRLAFLRAESRDVAFRRYSAGVGKNFIAYRLQQSYIFDSLPRAISTSLEYYLPSLRLQQLSHFSFIPRNIQQSCSHDSKDITAIKILS